MERYEVDYSSVLRTFTAKGYHTVGYNEDTWSGVWSDLAIEQTLMKPIKSSGGLKQGRFRNPDNAYKLWCRTLDHLSEVNEQMSKPITNKKPRGRIEVPHIDARISNREKDIRTVQQLCTWFSKNDPFDSTRKSDVLVSFSTGLISNAMDDINPDNAYHIGADLQLQHDGMGFSATMHTKGKVKPLSNLMKPIKVRDKDVYIDSMKLFVRLMVIGERELTLSECLSYELTHLPSSLFTDKQKMRKTNKAVLGTELRSRVGNVVAKNVAITVIDGGWLIYQVGIKLCSWKFYV